MNSSANPRQQSTTGPATVRFAMGPATAPDKTSHTVVIGGGLAGCTAALALARAGRRVTLVESKSRLGGRVGSYTDQQSGQSIDYCQHVGMQCCSSLRQLISWLDQSHQWHVQPELYFFGPHGQPQTLRALPLVPAPLHLCSWLWHWPGITWHDRLRIARALWSLNRLCLSAATCDQLDSVSALTWLRQQGQTPTALQNFWSTILVSALGEQLDRAGLLAMAKVFQDGFMRQRDAFQLLIPKRPLHELFGTRFQAALTEAGVELEMAAATRIAWQGAHCQRLELSNGRTLPVDQVIVAVPWHAVGRLLQDCPDDELKRVGSRAHQLEASPISGVHTWWDRPWLPTPHAVLVGRLCQWVFPHASAEQPATAAASTQSAGSAYYQIVISASHHLPRGDQALVARLIEEDLRLVFPTVRQARLERLRVVTDPQAVFSVGPGTHGLRPPAGSCQGNIYWAGDWVQTGWPATMEGAIRSGLAAAGSILGIDFSPK